MYRFLNIPPAPSALFCALWLLLASLPCAAEDRTLTLATWNIEHLAAADDQGCRPRKTDSYNAVRSYIKQAGADVIAFQEVENLRAAQRVFPASDFDIHISERPTLEFPECYDIARKRLMQRTGFAVRKDISDRLGLTTVRQPDVRELRGSLDSGRWGVHIVLAPIAPADGAPEPLHLLSVHLKSGCTYKSLSGNKPGSPCPLLREQVEVLSGWINTRARLKQDFIVAGDFNRQLDQLSDQVWLYLESGGHSGSYVDLEKALHGIKHPRPFNPRYPFAIDHIIYNQALDGLLLERQTFFDVRADAYSDHLLLFAVFDLTRVGGTEN